MSYKYGFGVSVTHSITEIDGRVCGHRHLEHQEPELLLERRGVNHDGLPWESRWFYECECELSQ